jgi:GT2 family glycosyltransferase
MAIQTSIIITSCNNFETTTGPCLKSLLKDKERDDFEIIVVDNASLDNTTEKVRELAAGEENVRLVINNSNRGFAGGNNDGAKIARGNILILLNSDTIVPQGTIGKLTRLLFEHPEWGMLGPVSNQAGNEQKILTRSENQDEIIREGEEWCARSKGDYFRSERLDFFCVAIRKVVFDRLRGFDERFGLGYYEDVDYSIRAKLEGIIMIFTEDCFVYHSAGKTFSKMGREGVKRLMHENKRALKKKYSGAVKLFHMRDMNLNIMKQYLLIKWAGDSGRINDLDYKFNNRLSLANTIYPHNPFKKLLYFYNLKRLCSSYLRYDNQTG